MRKFEEIFTIVQDTNMAEAAFDKGECEAMYEYLHKLPKGANLVEIGVQFGRSATVLACVAQDLGFDLTLVDNWMEGESPEAKANIEKQIEKYGWKVNKMWMTSVEASKKYNKKIDLVHIDANHSYDFVLEDIKVWTPKVKVGGYACFDDYGHDSLPDVYRACNDFFKDNPEWKFCGRYSNKFGVYIRIK